MAHDRPRDRSDVVARAFFVELFPELDRILVSLLEQQGIESPVAIAYGAPVDLQHVAEADARIEARDRQHDELREKLARVRQRLRPGRVDGDDTGFLGVALFRHERTELALVARDPRRRPRQDLIEIRLLRDDRQCNREPRTKGGR